MNQDTEKIQKPLSTFKENIRESLKNKSCIAWKRSNNIDINLKKK